LKPQYSNLSVGRNTKDNNNLQTAINKRIDEEKKERIKGILKFKVKIHYLPNIENKLKTEDPEPKWSIKLGYVCN
jgi:hypothetical protein